MNKLKKKIHIQGLIKTITGLHIGGTNNSMGIGDLDNAVIRHPINKQPFIPGSSLKGKMRSLLELAKGEFMRGSMGRDIKNVPSNNPAHLSAKLFGYTGNKNETYNAQQPSRIIVRDGMLTDAANFGKDLLSEVKSETVIDRLTSAAMPRQLERVPAGTTFKLDIVLNIFSDDDEKELIQGVFRGLQLIQDDYLGGAGSRGSGQVAFSITEVQEKPSEYYTGVMKELPAPATATYKATYIPASMA